MLYLIKTHKYYIELIMLRKSLKNILFIYVII